MIQNLISSLKLVLKAAGKKIAHGLVLKVLWILQLRSIDSYGLRLAYSVHCTIIALNQNIINVYYYNAFNSSSRFIYCLWKCVVNGAGNEVPVKQKLLTLWVSVENP